MTRSIQHGSTPVTKREFRTVRELGSIAPDRTLALPEKPLGSVSAPSAALPLMTAGGTGDLNASIQGSKVWPGFTICAATKAAIRSLARTQV